MSHEVPQRLILQGGTIRTMDPELGCAEAVGIAGGCIKAVGPRDKVREAMGGHVEPVDLNGMTVLPGLIDTHPHLLHFSLIEEPLVNITDATSHTEIVERIAVRAKNTEPGEWIMTTPVGEPHSFVTRSWRNLSEGRLPDRHVLDRASREHPVMIQAWAPVTPNALALNSMALARLGIDERTPEQIGEVWVEKDARGAPTGMLTGSVTNYYSSDSFNHSLWSQIPFVQLDKTFAAVTRGMRQYNAQGVTAIYENHGMEAAHIEGYRALRAAEALTLRVAVAQEAESYGLPWSRPKTAEEFVRDCEQAAASIELQDGFFRFLGMTFMRDGSCWPGTACASRTLAPTGSSPKGSSTSAKSARR
jgi:predicted amidohydrolase YtcJ